MSDAIVRRRSDGALELRVNGVFVMDDQETSSERALAHAVVERGCREVLVGGLGLGFTLRELLGFPDVTRVVVAELHGEIAGWMRDGTIPGADLLGDTRTELVIGDVRDVIAGQPSGALDAIVLDVDNGPDFLVHGANAAVYGAPFIDVCATKLRPGGSLCIWSMDISQSLLAALRSRFVEVDSTAVPVTLQGRTTDYWILTGSRPRVSDIVPP